MLDCSDAAINRWHTLNISWDCTTVAFTTLCQDCKKKTKALVLMNRKAMRVSPTHPGSRTRLCPLTLSAHNGSGGHPATELAVWRFSERFSITEPDWLRPFGIFLAHWFLLGEQLEVLLPLVGLFLPEGGRGGDSGGGTWTVHLDSVSTGNASHLAHTPSPLLPPPQPSFPHYSEEARAADSSDRSSTGRRRGEGGAAVPGPSVLPSGLQNSMHILDLFMIWKPLVSSQT